MLYLQPDMAAFARAQPRIRPVGEVWSLFQRHRAHSVAHCARTPQAARAAAFTAERLFKPLGMIERHHRADEHGTLVGSSYMYATARDWARYGQFLLQDGCLAGTTAAASGICRDDGEPGGSIRRPVRHGQVWLWGSDAKAPGVDPDAAFGIPADTFWMSGHDGQSIAVIRSRQLVIVRFGLTPENLGYSTQALVKAVLEAE